MKKNLLALLLCFGLINTFGQTQKKITALLFGQYNKTIRDRTKSNNPWGIGLGFQTFFNNKTKFQPTIEVTGDLYLEDDKVFRTDSTGMPLNDIRGMVNIFAGGSFNPMPNGYLSFLMGPSFISGQTLFGIKSSVGFYFPKRKRLTAKISYINIFDRDKATKQDFSSFSIAIGLRLF